MRWERPRDVTPESRCLECVVQSSPNTEILALIESHFPQLQGRVVFEPGARADATRFRYRTAPEDLRPGNTVSGPTLMAVSDLAAFFALAAQRSSVLMAVTTSLNINFLRKPGPGDLVVDARLLKHGKRLAVAEVYVFGTDESEPVSHATVTYSIAPL